jgi:hypothetical protein
MGYKIFYSYQSDINPDFNKIFIQLAIEKAITKLNNQGLDVSLDFGFRGTPGTTILISEMLDKSKNADLVIVDLTYTSSKAWYDSYKLNLFGKELRFLNNLIEKKSPNPNVLLETGYAWSQKGYNRTLAIMNIAFGNPEELPVDFKGFRYPIQYDFSEINITDRTAKLEELSLDLLKAFKTAMKAEIQYQIEKWKPIYVKSEWDKDHTYPYFLTPKLKAKIIEFRKLLESNNNSIRLIGPKNSGKTRLVNEIYKSNGSDLEYVDKNETFLYYDLKGPLKGDISKQLFDLKNENQSKHLILDNCSVDEHNKYSDLFKRTNVRIITIDTVSSQLINDKANLFMEEEIQSEIVENLLKEKFYSEGKIVTRNYINLSLTQTITLLENNLETEIGNKTVLELIKLILEEENDPEGVFNFLQFINTLGIVGVSNYSRKEFEYIKRLYFNHTNDNYLDTIIEVLVSKKLLSQKGDFVLTFVFENELMENWWHENKNSLNEIISRFEGTGLLNRFVNRLLILLKNENLIELKNLLFDKDSILINNEFTDTREGSELLNKLVTDFPMEVLTLLAKKIE